MHENLAFGVNASLPLVLLLGLGIILRKKNIVDENYVERTNDLLFWVVGPAIILHNMLGAELNSIVSFKLIAFIHGLLFSIFVVLWLVGSFIIKDKSSLGAFVHGVYRPNFGYIGVPLIMLMFSNEVAARGAVIQVVTMPAINILAVIILSSCTGDKKSIKETLKPILLNPLLLAAVVGMAIAASPIKIPEVFLITIDLVGKLSLPLSLILIGATFKWESVKKTLALGIVGAFIKSIITPAAAVFIAVAMGFEGMDLVIIFFYGASPSAVNAYIMTRKMGGNYDLNANIIILSTLMSSISIFIGIYLLKTLALI